jgi:hypothetical protein
MTVGLATTVLGCFAPRFGRLNGRLVLLDGRFRGCGSMYGRLSRAVCGRCSGAWYGVTFCAVTLCGVPLGDGTFGGVELWGVAAFGVSPVRLTG